MTNIIEPKLYVGTYHKYNCGSIEGKWLTLSDYSDKKEFLEACAELHSDERDPEYMFQDCEDFLDGWYSECIVPEGIWDFLDLDEEDQKKFYLYSQATGYRLQECMEGYEDIFYFAMDDAWDTMMELHPGLEDIMNMNLDFVHISELDFIDSFTRVKLDNETYLVETA